MSEKRFYELASSIDYYQIWDKQEDKGYTIEDAVDKLNEQQSLITALEKEHKRQENQIKLLNKQLSKIPPNIRKVWLYD